MRLFLTFLAGGIAFGFLFDIIELFDDEIQVESPKYIRHVTSMQRRSSVGRAPDGDRNVAGSMLESGI